MKEGVVRIHVENFKSLKDFTIDFKKFNVLIGANGSGKTNVLELFKFANLCVDPDRIPAYPFRSWSGFKNIIWSGDTNQVIRLQVSYSIAKYDFDYKITIGDSGGTPEFLDEELNISNYLRVLRSVQSLKYELDSKFLDAIKPVLSTSLHIRELLHDSPESSWIEEIDSSATILNRIKGLHIRPLQRYLRSRSMPRPASCDSNLLGCDINNVGLAIQYFENMNKPFLIPSIRIGDGNNKDFIPKHATSFLAGRHSMILLRQLNYAAIRESRSVDDSYELGEDGVGLIGMLFRWYNSNHHLPERFIYALENLFPSWQIKFDVTGDGRILLNVYDGNMILSPSSIPDGFYKLLAILAAVEMEPKFLLIDEIDASLHAEIIDYVLSELCTCESHVIVTTHSPLVIDAVELANVVILKRTESGTTCERIIHTDSMQKKLHDKGLTLSESWIYGGS